MIDFADCAQKCLASIHAKIPHACLLFGPKHVYFMESVRYSGEVDLLIPFGTDFRNKGEPRGRCFKLKGGVIMTVYFHGSFGLNRQYMSGLLLNALKNPHLKDIALAKPFGYAAPFGARYRSWLHKTGVAEMGLPMKLTELGKVLVDKDPSFETLTTQWFLHHELSRDAGRAEPWYFFANEFLPKHKHFTRAELLDGLTGVLRYHSEQHFGPDSKLNKVILRKIIECYTKKQALGGLNLLAIDGGKLVRNDNVSPLGPWKTVEALSKAYQ